MILATTCVEVLLKRRGLFLCRAAPQTSWIGALHAMHGFMIIYVPGTEKGRKAESAMKCDEMCDASTEKCVMIVMLPARKKVGVV